MGIEIQTTFPIWTRVFYAQNIRMSAGSEVFVIPVSETLEVEYVALISGSTISKS